MDAQTLAAAMGGSLGGPDAYARFIDGMNAAMVAADVTTPIRAAHWCAQIGHESGGLRWMAEIETSNPSWSWDRTRYRGRGPIQLTWQSNYRKFGQWCASRGYTSDPEAFVNQPELVEQPRWGFLAAAWYWLVGGPRPGQINAFADADDVLAVSRCVNGWVEGREPNGYADRRARLARVKQLGAALLPTGGTTMPNYGITKVMHGYRADTPANATGNSNGPRARTDFVVIHTQEGDGTAVSLANYLNSNDVSYNLVVDGTDTVEVVPVGEGPWAAAEANNIGVHICFAGSRAAWTREQWLARGAALDRAAKATAAACQQYGVPIVKILNGSGWNGTRGLAAHGDFGARGGGHTDPGPNFPWDDFIVRVKRFTNPNPGGTPMPTTDQNVQYIAGQLGPWPQLGTDSQGRPLTLVDAVAAMKTEQAEQGRILRALAAAAGVKA
ncbi:N-acetylmuramoyl-L-alanine amidase [Tsukamurella tyrosinosolvens]|uniref:N-acetylmuramoyl-L-alanine amidase n=1 Tax=Tsukamurella tyrosinosolvens TaxID=57704 RepID=UPI000DF6F0E8|nr:N-acetylmuramoyl-L-alanine amidase [Tsukamurella tyrosinosolvens]RDB46204.1 hypothetical protein DVB87_19745 [Tsukamurella tyrosinosolvens]